MDATGVIRTEAWRLINMVGLACIVAAVSACKPDPSPDSQISHRQGDFGESSGAMVQLAPVPAGSASATAELFAAQCAMCHGSQGRGDGPAAYLVYPKPRDLTSGVFRFKSTPGDAPPTLQDIERVMGEGIPHTAMPAFKGVLTDVQINSMASYVLSLGPKESAASAPPITIPAVPEFTPQLVEQGRIVFAALGCAQCHGETGRGDGPSSESLVDSLGMKIPPADFTSGVYKSGRTSGDLYRTIAIGVPGTPMPGYASSVASEIPGVAPDVDRIWSVVAYLKSLSKDQTPAGAVSGATIRVHTVKEAGVLRDPLHAAWTSVPVVRVSVQTMWQRKHAARSVGVRVARVRGRIAIHMEWDDETADLVDGSVHAFPDASGIMFSLTGEVPSLTMGVRSTGPNHKPQVNLWQWKASWQLHRDKGEPPDALAGDASEPSIMMYPFKQGDLASGPLAEHDKTFITAQAAGNVISDPSTFRRAAVESSAAGFGTLTPQPLAEQGVEAWGQWSRGKWHVVLVRALARSGDGDVDLSASARIPMSFAVWDGHASDRNGTKQISGWHWLEMRDK